MFPTNCISDKSMVTKAGEHCLPLLRKIAGQVRNDRGASFCCNPNDHLLYQPLIKAVAIRAISSNSGSASSSSETFPASSAFSARELSPASLQESDANCVSMHTPSALNNTVMYSLCCDVADKSEFIRVITGDIWVTITPSTIIPTPKLIAIADSGVCRRSNTARNAADRMKPIIAIRFMALQPKNSFDCAEQIADFPDYHAKYHYQPC